MRRTVRWGWAMLLVMAGWSGTARALDDSDKEAIRLLSNEAASDYTEGRYEAAREKFARAYAIAKVPKLGVWLGRTNEKLGRLVSAYELFREACGLEPNELWKGTVQQEAKKEACRQIDELLPRIPRLTIVIQGASSGEVSVKVDDVPVPGELLGVERLADPGSRQVVGRRGAETVSKTVTLAEGDRQQVVLEFGKAPEPTSSGGKIVPGAPPGPSTVEGSGTPMATPSVDRGRSGSRLRTYGWVGIGVGAAGLVLGGVTGILVASKYGDLNEKCPDRNCDKAKYESDVHTYRTLRTLSTVGFVVGGVAAAAGVTLLLTSPKEVGAEPVALWLVSGMAGIRGGF